MQSVGISGQTSPRKIPESVALAKRSIHLDFETFSAIDVRKVGAYRYARHPSTEVLILAYRIPGKPLRYWLPLWPKRLMNLLPDEIASVCTLGQLVPQDLQEAAEDEDLLFEAHNAEFEMNVWAQVVEPMHGGAPIPLHRWRCTAAKAASAGLPRSLAKLALALHLGEQKDSEGTRLINLFSKPRKPTKTNTSLRNYPWDRPEDFIKFVLYCAQDVRTEYAASLCLPDLIPSEWRAYVHTVTMNLRGLPLDILAVRNGYRMLREFENEVSDRVRALTGGVSATQRDKMLVILQGLGVEIEDLQAKTIKDIVITRKDDLSPEALELLQLRVEGGKASTKKLAKMIEVTGEDGVVRGGFLFYGAGTGRLAGKLVQPHNFIRGEYKPYQLYNLFDLIHIGVADNIRMLYEWPIDAMAQGMRGYIRARPGNKFVVVDFSAIEARVLVWLARQEDALAAYAKNTDMYKWFAVRLYSLQSQDDVTTPQRKFAKDLWLGCGYQLGVTGFVNNALKRGILVDEAEAKVGVRGYRDLNPMVVELWAEIEEAAIRSVTTCASRTNPVKFRNLAFFVEGIWFCILLPSGRCLWYPYPKVEDTVRFNRRVKKLTYRSEIKGKWVREGTYGGKLVENIVQAIARDFMQYACFTAERNGYGVIGTVHDELITEVPEGFGSPHELEKLVCMKPKWATDAPIGAEAWEGTRYRK